MVITVVQIGAGIVGLINLALYFFYYNDTLQQVENLLWVFMSVVLILHEDTMINLFEGEDEDAGKSDKG